MGRAPFRSTMWTQIREACGRDSRAEAALVERYRAPVINFAVRRGFSEHDAEDIAQEVFVELFNGRVLAEADASRGRFRSLVLAVATNVMKRARKSRAALKRGGGRGAVSLDDTTDGTPLGEFVAREDRNDTFDRAWMTNLVRLAFERLKAESERRYAALHAWVNERATYEELAKRLGRSVSDVRNDLHAGKVQLRKHVEALIREYASSEDEYRDELAYLLKFLG